MAEKFIYADNAATTRVIDEVKQEMLPYFTECYGNPSSLYGKGRDAKHALDSARGRIANIIGCDAGELYFTSGGTESDNWAIKGVAAANVNKGKHIITTKIEHPAVLNSLKALEKQGYEVTYLDVYENGIVRPEDLRAALRDDTVLVAVMFANNEIGTIQPIKELAAIAHERKAVFFTDAVQALAHVDINVGELGVDLMSMSGHKIHAPRGIGALYIRKGTRIANLIDGGGQESRRRSGTENVPGAIGMARALEYMTSPEGLAKREEIRALRDKLCDLLLRIPNSRLNGDRYNRLPGNLNVSFEFIEGESLILWLDSFGICASTGSACSTASLDPSHVLLAIGLPHEKAHGSLRLTLDIDTTDEDVEYIADCTAKVVDKLRQMSPLYEDYLKNNK